MTILSYWIAPQSPELKARTMLAHNTLMVRGMVCGFEHPSDLSYTLGLYGPTNQHCEFNWYAGVGNPVDSFASSECLRFAAQHFMAGTGGTGGIGGASQRKNRSGELASLRDFDTTAIWLRLRNLPMASQRELVRLLACRLSFTPNLNLSERAEIMKTSDTIPADVLAKLEMNLASLEASLLAKDPMMPQHLRATHGLLISYPETVHLLDDAEIARLIDAAQLHTEINIVKATAAKTARKKVSADDL